MRADSLAMVGREENLLQQAASREGSHGVGGERPSQAGESHLSSLPRGHLQLGSFAGWAGKKCLMYSRSQPVTEILTSPLPKCRWLS